MFQHDGSPKDRLLFAVKENRGERFVNARSSLSVCSSQNRDKCQCNLITGRVLGHSTYWKIWVLPRLLMSLRVSYMYVSRAMPLARVTVYEMTC